MSAAALASRGHLVAADVDRGRILRSVLMKPESETHAPLLLARIEELATEAP